MDQNNSTFSKVIVIDDSETERFIANRMITHHKFAEECVITESGEEALGYLRSIDNLPDDLPQFVFLDIRMPEMDGFEFLEAYAKLPEDVTNHCIVIMLSSSIDPVDKDIAKLNPFVKGFLSKPLSEEKLSELKKQFALIQ